MSVMSWSNVLRVVALLLHLPFFFYFILPCVSSLYKIIYLVYYNHETLSIFQEGLTLLNSHLYSLLPAGEASWNVKQLLNFASVSSVIIILIILLLLLAAIAQFITVLNVFILRRKISQRKLDILCCLWLIPPLILKYEIDDDDFFGHITQLNPLASAVFVIQVTYEHCADWQIESSAIGLLINLTIVLMNHVHAPFSFLGKNACTSEHFTVIVDKVK